MTRPWQQSALALLVVILTSCGPAREPVALLPAPTAVPSPAYSPIVFPRDEAPHDVLTEWWYYTGHLQAEDGRGYGFEYVVFQTVRGEFPVVYLGQFAVTDLARGTFRHASRLGRGSQIGRVDGFDLRVQDWHMQGALGDDRLSAAMDEYAIELSVLAQKPPALHDYDGLVSFGAAGDSYYYSRTRLSVNGTLVDHGTPVSVRGQAWFDHQWGDFLVLGGGWDWFSIQLDDGVDLMLNYLRDDAHRIVGIWGSLVDANGTTRPLGKGDFTIEPTDTWTSPRTGGTYPMGWRVRLELPGYDLRVIPSQVDQELVADGNRPTYWEGAAEVDGMRDGVPVRGLGYVELTGYARR